MLTRAEYVQQLAAEVDVELPRPSGKTVIAQELIEQELRRHVGHNVSVMQTDKYTKIVCEDCGVEAATS